MRIKNFLIFFLTLFLSITFLSFAAEKSSNTEITSTSVPAPATGIKPVAQPAEGAKSAVKPSVAEVKPVAQPVKEVKPEVKPLAQPANEVKSASEVTVAAAPTVSPAIETKNTSKTVAEVKPAANLFAETFFAPAPQKLDHKMSEVRGFPVIKSHSRDQNAEFSIVTDFGGGAIKSRYLSGLKDMKAVDEHIKKNLKTALFEGVEIRELPVPNTKGEVTELYWVGNRAFASSEEAMTAIIASKTNIELQGGDFAEAVRAVPVYVPEAEKPVEVKTPAQFRKEEELILKFTDQLGIGEQMYGVLQGPACGTAITWQSFGETSWRLTNLAANHFDTQVGYWTNRLVFSGIRFPLDNIAPFIEETVALQSDSADYASNLQVFAGLEWRPLARNPWLLNFQPFGGIPILEWMRNYRFYIKYGERYNIKGDITNSRDNDLIWGVQCYYEWNTEVPSLMEGKPEKFTDYLRQYVWGEYYGDYSVSRTNFSSEKSFNAFIANSTITVGIKLPGIPIPHNYINDEIILMPYMRFEHVNNSSFSFWYQNQYFVGAGVRWMPFMAYRWKENEWLSKLAVYGEWDGVGGAQRVKQNGEVPFLPNYDLRFGVKFSSRRF